MEIWQQVILRQEKLDKMYERGRITLKEYACLTNGNKTKFNAGIGALKAEDMVYGKPEYFNRLKKRGLIGNGALVTHTADEMELEVIECDQLNRKITRAECKETSGHNECDMALCEHNEETRQLLTNRLKGMKVI